MAKNSSGDGPKGNSRGSSGSSKGSSNKGSSSSKGSSNKGSSNTRGSGGDSKGLGNVGWGGGSKGPSFGGGSYSASTGFGKGDTGSSFGNFGGSGKGSGSGGGGGSKDTSKPTKGNLDAAFQNFRQDTPANTQLMQGALYTREEGGGWKNLRTGQTIEGKHLDRAAMYDSLKQENMLNRGYDDLTAVKNWFSGLNPFADEPKEQAGISPLGGWASYGGAVPGVEDTRGFFTKLGDTFQKFGWGMQDAPLKTLADLASNPFVSTVGAFTGTLPAMAALKGVSALKDVATSVMTPVEGALDLASTAVTHTPLGAALGELRGIATSALTGDPAKVAGGIGGFVGGKTGTGVGQAIGSALSSNPYGAAIGSMIGGTFGSLGGQQLASTAASSGKPSGVKGPSKESGKDTRPSSPLVSKGDTMIAATPDTEADPLKYIREMELPFYGPNYQVNTYGIPNTFMMGA